LPSPSCFPPPLHKPHRTPTRSSSFTRTDIARASTSTTLSASSFPELFPQGSSARRAPLALDFSASGRSAKAMARTSISPFAKTAQPCGP
jgi:hypothetical protein